MIDWKDDSKNLTKLYPRIPGETEGDDPAEAGSFFHFFEEEEDRYDVRWVQLRDASIY